MHKRPASSNTKKPTPVGLRVALAAALCVCIVTALCSCNASPEGSAQDKAGSSRSYRMIAEMQALEYQSMTVADFSSQVQAICEREGINIFSLLANVSAEIDDEDPLYPFYLTVMSHTSSELFARQMGGDEVSFSSGQAKKIRYQSEREIDEGSASIVFFADASYLVVYDIPDPMAITVGEREQVIARCKEDIQAFVDAMDEEDMRADNASTVIAEELARLSERNSTDRMTVSCEFLQLGL